MCAAFQRLCRVLRCCVTSRAAADRPASLDDDDGAVWSVKRRYLAAANGTFTVVDDQLAADDDASTPVPVCCCERCDGVWFPPEASLDVRSCGGRLLDHVTAGRSLSESGRRQRRARWTGDVIYLDDVERSEMSVMSRDFKGVDLLVGDPLDLYTTHY